MRVHVSVYLRNCTCAFSKRRAFQTTPRKHVLRSMQGVISCPLKEVVFEARLTRNEMIHAQSHLRRERVESSGVKSMHSFTLHSVHQMMLGLQCCNLAWNLYLCCLLFSATSPQSWCGTTLIAMLRRKDEKQRERQSSVSVVYR